MKRIIIATLLALGTGCGDAPVEQTYGLSHEGIEIACSGLEPGEERFRTLPGYDDTGCTKSERMFNVTPWADEADQAVTDLGEAKLPISVANGTDAATRITVNGSSQISGFQGKCPVDFGWTTAQPVIANCIIPEVVNALQWAVCPTCWDPLFTVYLRNRMKEAWDVWRNGTTSTCGSTTYTSHVRTTATSEKTNLPTPQENYDAARIVVYPMFGEFVTARMGVDKDLVFARTPIRNGIRYYSWQYAAIQIDTQFLEGVKYANCVSATDPQGALKLQRGYRWVIAHEIGHGFGMPHRSTGIMRSSANVTCGELFSAASTAPALSAPSSVERLIVNALNDSGGFSVLNPGANCGDANPISSTTVPDDESVVAF